MSANALVQPATNITIPCPERKESSKVKAKGAVPKRIWGLGVRRKEREPVVMQMVTGGHVLLVLPVSLTSSV
jgi:hypothetical protein